MVILYLFGRSVQPIWKVCPFRFILSVFIVAEGSFSGWQPLCYNQSPAFTQNFQKKGPFISANTYEKYIVCKDYCIAHHDDKTCFLPACKYQIILFGEIKELLQNLDKFCFTYQHVDCLFTIFSSTDSVEKLLQRVEMCLTMCNAHSTLIT